MRLLGTLANVFTMPNAVIKDLYYSYLLKLVGGDILLLSLTLWREFVTEFVIFPG